MEREWIRKQDALRVINNTETAFVLATKELSLQDCSTQVMTDLLRTVADRIDALKGQRLDDDN